jgi:hypothetical protein
MNVALSEKDRSILLGLIAETKRQLESGEATATPQQRADLPEAYENLRRLQRKLRLGH